MLFAKIVMDRVVTPAMVADMCGNLKEIQRCPANGAGSRFENAAKRPSLLDGTESALDASYQSRGILMKGLIVIAIGFVFTTVLFLAGLNVWGGS